MNDDPLLDLGAPPATPATLDSPDGPNSPNSPDSPRGRARRLVAQLVADATTDQSLARRTVEGLGRDAQVAAGRFTRLLDAPVTDLVDAAGDGGDVATALAELIGVLDRIDPSGVNARPGWGRRTLGAIPGVGSPVRRYFERFQAAQPVLDRTVMGLRKGRDQLRRDIITLEADQGAMRDVAGTLTACLDLAEAVDHELAAAVAAVPAEDPRGRFLREEMSLSVRQRTVDLQQQLAVTQQGILAMDILTANSRRLIRGVEQALDVTVAALKVAVAVALAVARQKLVIDAVDRTSGTIGATVTNDMAALRAAFAAIHQALDQIDHDRKETSTVMTNHVLDATRSAPAADAGLQL